MGPVDQCGRYGGGPRGRKKSRLRAHVRGYLAHVADQCGPCNRTQDIQVPRARQLPQHPGFVAPDARYDCRQCIAWHGERFDFPPLPDDVGTAWALYFALQGQQRSGGMDVLGLDFAVLPVAFALYSIPAWEQRELFEQLCVLDGEAQRWRAHKRELEEQKRKMTSASRSR